MIERPAPGRYVFDTCFAGGTWRPCGGTDVLPVHDSATEEEIGAVRSASTVDVDAAVAAAQAALPAWRALSVEKRAGHLRALQAALQARGDELVSVISAEVGTAVRMCGPIQVASSVNLLGLTADLVLKEVFEERAGNSVVVHEPVGVVAAITPWNYPLFQTMAKVAAALAAGCVVVHKPSELAPVSAYLLAQAVEAAGLPGGVYNLVPGTGPAVGEALAGHPDVDMVSFTGSTKAGRRVYELSAASLNRVALELGGKSASVLLDDADVEMAVKSTVNRACLNSGQTCDAWTRLLVPVGIEQRAVELAVASARRLTVGDPFDPATRLGPLISATQRKRVEGYVADALAGGAQLATGGIERPPGLKKGHYFQPTILTGVLPEMPAAREEIFGPVLVVLPYEGLEQAVELANGTDYGLSGAVWSAEPRRAEDFARRMQAGQVVINGGKFNPLAPFGGVKLSGLGREQGVYGIREFLDTKALQW